MWRFDRARAKSLTWEGMPLFWSTMARNIYVRGTELMIKSLANPAALGYYAAANRIIDLYAIVPGAIVGTATPIVSKSRVQDRAIYLKQMTLLFRVTSAIGIVSTIGVSLVAPWIMPLIYGEEFAGASSVLSLSMWSTIPFTFNLITGTWVINEGLMHVSLQKTVVMAGLTVALNWWLIPLYAAPGAAMSGLIASIIVNIIWDFVDPRMRPLNYLKLHALFPWWFGLERS